MRKHAALAFTVVNVATIVAAASGCGAGILKISGKASKAESAQIAESQADGLEARLEWSIPSPESAAGEINKGDTERLGYVGTGVTLNGGFPAQYTFDASIPPPEAMVHRNGMVYAEGMLVVSTPAALDALERLEQPAEGTTWGGASVNVMYVESISPEGLPGAALFQIHEGFNLITFEEDAVECYVKQNHVHRDINAEIAACADSCADDACVGECADERSAAGDAQIEALACPNPLEKMRALPLDAPIDVELKTFDPSFGDFDGDGLADLVDPVDDSVF